MSPPRYTNRDAPPLCGMDQLQPRPSSLQTTMLHCFLIVMHLRRVTWLSPMTTLRCGRPKRICLQIIHCDFDSLFQTRLMWTTNNSISKPSVQWGVEPERLVFNAVRRHGYLLGCTKVYPHFADGYLLHLQHKPIVQCACY